MNTISLEEIIYYVYLPPNDKKSFDLQGTSFIGNLIRLRAFGSFGLTLIGSSLIVTSLEIRNPRVVNIEIEI